MNKRLLIRNKILLNINLFVNRIFILKEDIEELKYASLNLEELRIVRGAEYIYKLEVLNKKLIDDLVTENYETFI